MRKLVVFIAMSLDGYIAKPDDNLDFLKLVEKEGEDYGYSAFVDTIDTIIVGRKTYDWVSRTIGAAHYDNGERDVYVITRSERPGINRTVFYKGELAVLVRQLQSAPGKNIYCDGGAAIIDALLKQQLVDEFTISVIPVFLGEGVRLFKDGSAEQELVLLGTKTFESGLVQLHYQRKLIRH